MWWYVPSKVMSGILDASWHATFLVVVVLAFQWVMRKKLPARWRFALWLLVLVRLSGVALPESRLSVFNWVPKSPVEEPPHVVMQPEIGHLASLRGAPPEAKPVVPQRLTPAWFDVAIGIYLAGLGVVGARIVISMWRVRGVLKRGVALEDSGIRACLVEARRVMGVECDVPVVVSEEMGSPALVGWWRPVMVVPRRLIGDLTMREWEFVFLHECAHLKRNDVLVNYWVAVLGAVHWFNPVAWLVWPRVRADRELACDEQVVMATAEAGAYGETLLKMFDGATRLAPPLSPAAVGVIGTKAFFKRRIQMIAAFRKRPAWLAVPAVGMLLAVGAATLTSAVTVVAADVAKVHGGEPAVFTIGKAPAPATAASPKELDTLIPEIIADQQGLEKILNFLADTTHLNVAVNWQALETAGVDKNSPVTLHLKNVPLHKVLDVAFSQLSQTVGYEFSDNVLTVSTAALLPANGAPRSMEKVVRVYNVRDLVGGAEGAGIPVAPGAQQVNPQTGEVALLPYPDTQKLEQVIMSTVEPTSWVTNGGSAGSMQDFHGLITVTATQGVQDQVAELLENLRKADKEQGKK